MSKFSKVNTKISLGNSERRVAVGRSGRRGSLAALNPSGVPTGRMAVELSDSVVDRTVREYEAAEPLYEREREHLRTFPSAFADGEYGWKDAQWVVRWYFRRYLGAYPDDDRAAVEDAFDENDFEAVRGAVDAALAADDLEARLRALTELSGVDVAIASAFLFFFDSERFLVVGEREWGVLRAAGELVGPYPDPPSPAAYERYLTTARSLTEKFDCTLWDLYRCLWRLGGEQGGEGGSGREG